MYALLVKAKELGFQYFFAKLFTSCFAKFRDIQKQITTCTVALSWRSPYCQAPSFLSKITKELTIPQLPLSHYSTDLEFAGKLQVSMYMKTLSLLGLGIQAQFSCPCHTIAQTWSLLVSCKSLQYVYEDLKSVRSRDTSSVQLPFSH